MATPLSYPIHSIAAAVAQIDQGEDPWFAIGCFLHDWWSYAVDQRKELIGKPPSPTTTPDGKRWAAFCAAMVEELCIRTSFSCPAWVHKQTYVLEDPWFFSSQVSQREWLLLTTPESFRRRNIFAGGSVLDNKYELRRAFGSKPRWTIWSEQELHNLAAD